MSFCEIITSNSLSPGLDQSNKPKSRILANLVRQTLSAAVARDIWGDLFRHE
jgi:hypothetical protein